MSKKVDFEKEIAKKRQENIKDVREHLKLKDMQHKINSYAQRYGLEPNYVEQLIVDDIVFAMNFAKDPGRQSIHENIVAEHIDSLDIVKENGEFIKLPARGSNAKYVTSHGVKNYRVDNEKSIDFEIKIGEHIVYATCKYTKDDGGAQDNQYIDVRNYIKSAITLLSLNRSEPNVHFIAIVDGDYYQRKRRLHILRQLGLDRVKVLSVNDVEDYLKTLVK